MGSCVICEPLGCVSVDNIGRYSIDILAYMLTDTRSSYRSTYEPTPGRSGQLLVDMLTNMLRDS